MFFVEIITDPESLSMLSFGTGAEHEMNSKRIKAEMENFIIAFYTKEIIKNRTGSLSRITWRML